MNNYKNNEYIKKMQTSYYLHLKKIQEQRGQLQMLNHHRETLKKNEIMKNRQYEYDRLIGINSRTRIKMTEPKLNARLNALEALGIKATTGN